MTKRLECGHPEACYLEDEGCEWCDDIHRLKTLADGYREQLSKQAIILTPGEYDLRIYEVGLLVIHGGTVNFAPDPNQPTTLPRKTLSTLHWQPEWLSTPKSSRPL